MKLMHNMKFMRNPWDERRVTMFAHRQRGTENPAAVPIVFPYPETVVSGC